jgi:hypothetical protein
MATRVEQVRERVRQLLQVDLALASLKENTRGDFLVRYEATNAVVVFDPEDPLFIWLHDGGLCWIKADDAQRLALADRLINETNHRCKVVKLWRHPEPDPDGEHVVTATVGFLVEDISALKAETLERYLFHVQAGARHFLHEFVAPAAEQGVPIIDLSGSLLH